MRVCVYCFDVMRHIRLFCASSVRVRVCACVCSPASVCTLLLAHLPSCRLHDFLVVVTVLCCGCLCELCIRYPFGSRHCREFPSHPHLKSFTALLMKFSEWGCGGSRGEPGASGPSAHDSHSFHGAGRPNPSVWAPLFSHPCWWLYFLAVTLPCFVEQRFDSYYSR